MYQLVRGLRKHHKTVCPPCEIYSKEKRTENSTPWDRLTCNAQDWLAMKFSCGCGTVVSNMPYTFFMLTSNCDGTLQVSGEALCAALFWCWDCILMWLKHIAAPVVHGIGRRFRPEWQFSEVGHCGGGQGSFALEWNCYSLLPRWFHGKHSFRCVKGRGELMHAIYVFFNSSGGWGKKILQTLPHTTSK